MKPKKILLMGASLVAVAAISIAGTLAFLTDRDSATNVFTMGDVSIRLNENFQQGAELMPGVGITKEPTITNTGRADAWVWATIAFPAALDSDDASTNVVHFNYETNYVNEDMWTWKTEDNAWNVAKNVEINGALYNVYTVLYQSPLEPGETTKPVMTKVYMDTAVDIAPNGDWYKVVDGEATKLNWNSNENGDPIIYVSAYACQTKDFDTVQDAYAAYNAQWGGNGTEYAEPATIVSNADELTAALTAGEDVVLTEGVYDLGGETVALADGATIIGNGAVIADAQFTVADAQTAAFEGVEFDGATTIRSMDDGALTFTDCEFNITPEKLNGNGRAAAIIGNHQYSTVDLYLDGCTFNYEAGGADTYNAAIFMWSSVKNAEIKNCTFNGYGFVAVKLMNVAEDANIVFEGNTFNMSAVGSANYWYNCAVQIVPQHDRAVSVTFRNNAFNGGYQTGADLVNEFGFAADNTDSIVAEIAGMNYGFGLSKLDLTIEGNTVNGVDATANNFAVKTAE